MAARAKSQRKPARSYTHIAGRLFGTPLLVDTRKLDAIVPIFLKRINGEADGEPDTDDMRQPSEMAIDPSIGIAVIPVIGSIVRRPTWLDAYSGLTSYGEIAENLECALNDARVKGILFQIDSFGGEAPGCFELCDKIYAARARKPIWGIADVDAMSAGYAILSSCERCYAAPQGATGSIGVVSVHMERSQQNAMIGLTYTVFRAGDRKADFNPFEKLTADAATKLLTSMERTRETFVATVARNRASVTAQAALDTEGQWYDTEDALALGLIDGVSTYETVFADFLSFLSAPAPAAIEAPETPAPVEPPDNDDDDIAPDEPGELPISSSTEDRPAMATDNGIRPPPAAAQPPAATPATPAVPATAVPAAVAAAAPAAPAPVTAAVVALDDARQPAETRAIEIAGLCKLAGFPAEAPDFIAGSLSVEEVRAKLIDKRAATDNAGAGHVSGLHGGGSNGGGGIPATGFSARPNQAALASWDTHFKAAQATNPKFAAAQARGLIPTR